MKTVQYIKENQLESPKTAWEIITKEIFGEGTASQKKGCPRTTFLGLCETGIVTGIPVGAYTTSQKNKEYGLKALELIRKNPDLMQDKKTLWLETIGYEKKVHTHR